MDDKYCVMGYYRDEFYILKRDVVFVGSYSQCDDFIKCLEENQNSYEYTRISYYQIEEYE